MAFTGAMGLPWINGTWRGTWRILRVLDLPPVSF